MRSANDPLRTPAGSRKTFPTKLAFIHPIWFLVITVVAFVAPLFTMNGHTGAIVATAFLTVWVLLLPLGWAHGIYRVARYALAKAGAVGASRDWIFYVAEIGVICVPILGLGSNLVEGSGGAMEGLFGLIGFALIAIYFASPWLSSAALVAFEDRTPSVAIHKVVGTFLLMVYWMIGAWVMQRRLKALREATMDGASSVA